MFLFSLSLFSRYFSFTYHVSPCLTHARRISSGSRISSGVILVTESASQPPILHAFFMNLSQPRYSTHHVTLVRA